MAQRLLGRLFPFIPLGLGLLLIILQLKWGTAEDVQAPVKMMFVLIISCQISWLFATAGLLIYKEILFTYYQQLFKLLAIIYLVPLIILAFFIPWLFLFNLIVFLSGVFIIRKIGWKYK
jgi:hypothetical protein